MNYNYNDDATLLGYFASAHKEQIIQIADGHIYAGPHGYIARCDDDANAERLLIEAGYEKTAPNRFAVKAA